MTEPFVVGATFRDVSIGRRELLTFVDGSPGERVRTLFESSAVSEVILLSTCNRVEIYGVPGEGVGVAEAANSLRETWAALLGSKKEMVEANTTLWEGSDAVKHAFRVMASLDSLVVGEAQILGQAKESYRVALRAGSVGPVLRELFEQGFRAAKRVRTETEIGKESVSVGSVAVDLAKQIFDPLDDTKVLLVGAGKIARLAAHHLEAAGVKSVTVANRTYARAEELADRHGWTSRRFEDLDLLLPEMDIVITSTGASRPVISIETVRESMERRRYQPVFFIDVALPRDVAADVADLDRVYLYNIDDLESIANRNLHHRATDIQDAGAIVERSLEKYAARRKLDGHKPFLARFAGHTEEVRDQEVTKALKRLGVDDERGRKVLFQMAHNIVQRLTRGAYQVVKEQPAGQEFDRITSVLAESYGVDSGVEFGEEVEDCTDQEDEAAQ